MVLAALFVRERPGVGQRVQTSLLQAVLALQSGSVLAYPGLETGVFRATPTYRLYQAGDGRWFFLAVGNQSFWMKLCKAIGHEELARDPRFGSWLARRDHADVLMPLLESAFASKPCDEWLRTLAEHDIPGRPTPPPPHSMPDPPGAPHKMVLPY